MKRLVIASTNPNKLVEFRSALVSLAGFEIISQPAEVPAIEETGATFMENAVLKAVHASRFVDDPVLGDDSGLCIDALDGRPGLFSHRYAETADTRIRRVLREMVGIPIEKRSAAFVCALALALKGRLIWTGEGSVSGRIHDAPQGTNGFGYDPIFFLPEFGRTMAELTSEEKNQTSHRGRAVQRFLEHVVRSGDPDL
jgi:XTP/dITP diphosphohydrolase